MAYLGESIPKLGFGLMRLPMQGDAIDIGQVKEMTDRFMAAGFRYFDTAYGYNNGKSEEAAKAALVDRYPRDSFYLATKLPAWAGPKTAEEAKAMFDTSLRRTGAGYFDFYLLHNLGGKRSKFFDDYGIWDYVQEKKAAGLIRHVGFSFHDEADVLEEILTKHPEMEFVQLQINYIDWESNSVQSRRCYEVARAHGKPIVIMEPVKGGNLASLPESAAGVLRRADPEASLSSWAIRFAASLPGVITVLSGMSSIEQMDDNLKTMKDFKPLSESEREVIREATEALEAVPRIPCTGCQYCMKGCPQHINIPGIFTAVNTNLVYGNLKGATGGYFFATMEGGKAGDCVGCGQCERVCPQHIGVVEELKKAKELFGK